MPGLDIKPLPPTAPATPIRRIEPRDGAPQTPRRQPRDENRREHTDDTSTGIDTFA